MDLAEPGAAHYSGESPGGRAECILLGQIYSAEAPQELDTGGVRLSGEPELCLFQHPPGGEKDEECDSVGYFTCSEPLVR
jgi:hypothetical protein